MQKGNFFRYTILAPKWILPDKKSKLWYELQKLWKFSNILEENNLLRNGRNSTQNAKLWQYTVFNQNIVQFCIYFTQTTNILHAHCPWVQNFLHLWLHCDIVYSVHSATSLRPQEWPRMLGWSLGACLVETGHCTALWSVSYLLLVLYHTAFSGGVNCRNYRYFWDDPLEAAWFGKTYCRVIPEILGKCQIYFFLNLR